MPDFRPWLTRQRLWWPWQWSHWCRSSIGQTQHTLPSPKSVLLVYLFPELPPLSKILIKKKSISTLRATFHVGNQWWTYDIQSVCLVSLVSSHANQNWSALDHLPSWPHLLFLFMLKLFQQRYLLAWVPSSFTSDNVTPNIVPWDHPLQSPLAAAYQRVQNIRLAWSQGTMDLGTNVLHSCTHRSTESIKARAFFGCRSCHCWKPWAHKKGVRPKRSSFRLAELSFVWFGMSSLRRGRGRKNSA